MDPVVALINGGLQGFAGAVGGTVSVVSTIRAAAAKAAMKAGSSTPADINVYRAIVLSKNIEAIMQHNADSNRTFNMSINEFTDL